jgi:Carboxypeptidase regulatory-like domain
MKNYLLAIALCLPLGAAFAQTAGSITGEVKDPSGAVAPNAAVTVTNSETNVARSTVTNGAGNYSFPDLTRGIYQIKVAAAVLPG